MKKMKILMIIIGSYLIVNTSCSKKENPTIPPEIGSEITPFTADFDDNIFPPISLGIDLSLNDYPYLLDSGYIKIVSDTVREGGYALKIIVAQKFQTQQPSFPIKNRNEVNYKHQNIEGTEVWYQWSFLIPTNFIELDQNLYPDSWNIIGQFHAIPDPEHGMPSAAGTNPPVALYLGRETSNGPFGVKLNYGIMNDNAGATGFFTVTKGKWVDFKMHIKWSQNDNIGFIEAWANDSLITSGKHYGKNMHNTKPHYWKTGFYRGAGMPYNNSIFIDEFRVGNNESEVFIQ